jgi:hypothetical protein
VLKDSILSSEGQSRLLFWMTALNDARDFLVLGDRALEAQSSEEVRERERRDSDALQRYRVAQPNYVPGTLLLSHVMEFRQVRPREFADYIDCLHVVVSARMFAIVLICQIFKPGNAAQGMVASNTREFVSRHLDRVLDVAGFDEIERSAFSELRTQLEVVRDKVLAHADADAFKHFKLPDGSRLEARAIALKGIDFARLRSFVERLREAVLKYSFETHP